jgi:RNA polymerase sigma factor (sigma-70 family)
MATFSAHRRIREVIEASARPAAPTSRAVRSFPLSPLPRWTTLDPLVKSVRHGTGDSHAEEPVRDAGDLLTAVARQRDRTAFASLFRLYGPRLKGHLLGRGADSGTAEEIVQDVMLTVWQKAEQFDARRGSASTWLYTLARNAFIDRVRREHRPCVDPHDPILDALHPGADCLVIDAESQRELATAVEALPAEQQHVVKLTYFHGRSLSQISVADGLPLGTVKTRARLALSRLRALVTHRRET